MRCLAALVLFAGCAAEPRESLDLGACDDPLARSIVDRHVMGEGAHWSPDGTLRAREDALRDSMGLRREVGWDVIRRAVTPAPLAVDVPGANTLPAWQTWYDIGDLRRVFDRLYVALPAEERAARASFLQTELDAAFAWNPTSIASDASWTEERLGEHLASLDEDARVAGVGGLSRTTYNGPAARHILSSYAEILDCRDEGAPASQAVGDEVVVPVTRRTVSVAGCGSETVGTYAVTQGESLVVTVEGSGAVTTHAGEATCTTAVGQAACVVDGPASVDVVARAGVDPVQVVVDVSRHHVQPPAWAACLAAPFPNDSVILKADYRRADFDFGMPVFDTSGAALPERLATSWDTPDGTAEPLADEAYTLELAGGDRYRLAALHIMTKELDHWVWTTMWWSDDPDSDFGADRPDGIAGPWDHYKMCTVTAFDEGDPAPWVGVEDASLAQALRATHGDSSWCSNPFIEVGHGNADTNCIGCHQHAGARSLDSQAILQLDDRGRTEVRNNFPADYAWSITHGEDLEQLFADRERFYAPRP